MKLESRQLHFETMDVSTTHPNITRVEVAMLTNDGENITNAVLGVGYARRAKGDKHDPNIALAQATARALTDLAAKLDKQVRQMVYNADLAATVNKLRQDPEVQAERAQRRAEWEARLIQGPAPSTNGTRPVRAVHKRTSRPRRVPAQ